MTKSYRKNILRDLKSNLSRFASLFGIVLLGAMMLTGLMSFSPSMHKAGDKYFAQRNVFDIRVLSTLGLSDDDISAIAAVSGVEAVMPVKSLDTEGHFNQDAQSVVVQLQQLQSDPEADTAANMNRLRVLSGRLPEAAGECAVHVMGHGDEVELGSTLTLTSSDGVSTTTYTVVGTVQDPLHFSSDAETSTAGDGSLDYIVFVPEGSLTADYYTTCYIKVENAAQYSAYSDEYQALMDEMTEKIEAISGARCAQRQAELIDDANAELATAREEYETQKAEAEAQLADAEAQLSEAEAQLEAALEELNAGEEEYAAGEQQLEQQKAALPDTMQSGADEVLAGEEQVLEFEDNLQQIELLVNLKSVADPMLTYAEAALDNAQKALDEAEPDDENYTELRDVLAKAQSAYDNIYNQLESYQQQLDSAKQQMYEQGLVSSATLPNDEFVTEAKAALRQMKLELMSGQLSISTGSATAYTQFEQAEAQLEAAREQLDEGWSEYNAGKQQLETARTEYESQKADAEAQLADGLKQLNDAEEQISDINSGEWYVLDRGSTVSFVTFSEYADRMAAIGRVFPVFFFLVAALVASTTMTRMVDENRLQMGTLKALGYSGAHIAAKYVFYGVAASLLGSLVGMALGFIVFPTIIWNAYTMIFTLPTFTLHFYPGLAAAAVILNVAVIGLTTLQACMASLREKSAALLLPRAPAAGKRILLEHITPLWNRMSFSQKTAARNLFRYKKRFFMTVLGVAGCTALLLVGFGIQDSILPILDKQNSEITHTDLTVALSDERALTTENGLSDVLAGSGIESWGTFYTKSITIYNADGESASVTAVAAEDEAKLTEFFTLRTRRGHSEIAFDENSVILTEKTASSLGLKVGDTFLAENPSGERVELTLTGITENYVFTRLYLSRQSIETLLGTADFEWNTVYAKTTCETQAERDGLSRELLACNYVSSASFASDTMLMFGNLIGRMNYVIYLIIVCAAALAAVVLYNLISVNLAERKKELATIKVLGFYNKEVYRYIFREIELLALIGSGVGLLLGVPLHKFIVLTVEMDQMMFIRDIAAPSYLYSVALTMVFTFAVCFVMRRSVRRISMVESMKAPE